MEDDSIRALLVILVATAIGTLQTARFTGVEKWLLRLALVAHGVTSFIHIFVMSHFIDGGDLFSYTRLGGRIAEMLRLDFQGNAFSVVQLVFHMPTDADLGTADFEGNSSGAMIGISAWLSYLTGGEVHTLGAIVSMAAYFGQLALYRAFKSEFPAALHRRLLFAAMLVPSAIFWSSALLKETIVTVGFGHAILAMVRLRRRKTTGDLIRLVAGTTLMAITKPYVVLALLCGSGVWLYAESSLSRGGRFRAGYVVLALSLSMAGVLAIGRVFPRYAVSGIIDQAITQHAASARVEGGSNFADSDEEISPEDMPLWREVAFAPAAIATAIYRPAIFDVKSPQLAVNALETTVLLLLTLRALRRRGVRGAWSAVSQNPMLMFALVFSTVLAFGVGLSTTNFGTLSRYRMPLVSCFWALILALDSREPLEQRAPAKRPAIAIRRARLAT